MKRYRWNKKKFVRNMLVIAIFVVGYIGFVHYLYDVMEWWM